VDRNRTVVDAVLPPLNCVRLLLQYFILVHIIFSQLQTDVVIKKSKKAKVAHCVHQLISMHEN